MSTAIETLREFDLEMPPMRHHGSIAHHTRADNSTAIPEDKLFSMYLKNHALTEDVTRDELFFWTAEISNSSLDSWFTRMAKNSLENYTADAADPSVMFQDSHARNELGVGRSLTGSIVLDGTPPAGLAAEDYFPVVYADFFAIRDLQLGKMSTNDFIKGVQRGVIKDVSIGFKEGEGFQYTCSCCGMDMWDWDCPHIPGYTYDMVDNPDADPSGQTTHEELCYAWIENARLSEVSAIYDGATTNAMVIKATREARAGRLDRNTKEFLEHRYRFTLNTGRKLWTGVDVVRKVIRDSFTEPGDESLIQTINDRLRLDLGSGNFTKEQRDNMSTTPNPQPGAPAAVDTPIDYTPQFRQACVDLGISIDEKATAQQCVAAMRAEIEGLRPASLELKELRGLEIDEAVKEKIRAHGDKTDEAKTRKMLATADIATIREFKAEWKDIGDKRFAKGRSTVEGEDGAEDERTPEEIKAAADAEAKAEEDRKAKATGRTMPSVASYSGI